MASKKRTILLYGRTRSGKSTQLSELAAHIYKTTGKLTRLYTADRGGVDPIQPLIDLGVIELVSMENTPVWIFLNKAVQGYVRDTAGKWVPGKNENIGMFAFESMTAFADALMADMAIKAAAGVSIGGGANISFLAQGDGETVKISGSNMAMYGCAQTRITEEVWTSQKLNAPYILWTASVSKDEDTASSNKVLGPAVCGKALTSEIPRWFQLTFRIDCLPAQSGKGERHILYLGNSVDVGAGNAVGLGNTRTPLGAPDLPTSIEPADLVKALEMIDNTYKIAFDAMKKRLGIEK
jgi:energy-coupling factor transporter ATP-binding protein EcfA2